MAPAPSPRVRPIAYSRNGPAQIDSLPLADHFFQLHATLTARDLWTTLRLVLREGLKPASFVLEIGQEGDGSQHKAYRHAHPTPPPEWWREHPAKPWLEQHPGAPVCLLSKVIAPEELRKTPFYERVMKREGWDRRLSILSWRDQSLQGALHLYNRIGGSDFTAHELRLAEDLQPHFHVALTRVLTHEERVVRAGQFAAMLEELPVGLLLLDWEGRRLWNNTEGALGCAAWNYGECGANALKIGHGFRVPPALSLACAEMREQWEQAGEARHDFGMKPRIVNEGDRGLYAQISLQKPGASPLLRPTFQIQLDYRRPRGDRNRPLSPGTVALLGRLSNREREVAMQMREGLRTAEIATHLRRSPLTIKKQLASIYAKLGPLGRTRAVAILNR